MGHILFFWGGTVCPKFSLLGILGMQQVDGLVAFQDPLWPDVLHLGTSEGPRVAVLKRFSKTKLEELAVVVQNKTKSNKQTNFRINPIACSKETTGLRAVSLRVEPRGIIIASRLVTACSLVLGQLGFQSHSVFRNTSRKIDEFSNVLGKCGSKLATL